MAPERPELALASSYWIDSHLTSGVSRLEMSGTQALQETLYETSRTYSYLFSFLFFGW